jgi:hypothetical protein
MNSKIKCISITQLEDPNKEIVKLQQVVSHFSGLKTQFIKPLTFSYRAIKKKHPFKVGENLNRYFFITDSLAKANHWNSLNPNKGKIFRGLCGNYIFVIDNKDTALNFLVHTYYYNSSSKQAFKNNLKESPNYFPYINIPLDLDIFLNERPFTLEKPVEPPVPKLPEKNLLSTFLLILNILSFFIDVTGIQIFLFFTFLLWFWIDRNNFIQQNKEYEILMQKYIELKKTYQEAQYRYYNYLRKVDNPEGLIEVKTEILHHKLMKIYSNFSHEESKKGISEPYFFTYLKRWFPNEIFDNLSTNYNLDFRTYQPDFVFKSLKNNLHIDIEIDEPYILGTTSPIHYIDKNSNKSIDYIRDEYFTYSNWIIIRFSEEQVVKNPNECCRIIAETITKVTNDKSYLEKFEEMNIPSLEYLPRWYFSDILNMKKNNYREKYLFENNLINYLPNMTVKTKTNENKTGDILPF